MLWGGLTPVAVKPHVFRPVVEIVAEPRQRFGPSGILTFQMNEVHQRPSDQTVGKTSGSLKSGSPLASFRQSCSSNMWMSRP